MKKLLCIFLLAVMIGCGQKNSVGNSGGKNIETVQTEKTDKQEKKVSSEKENMFSIKNISAHSESSPRIEAEFTDELKEDSGIEAYVKISPETKYTVLKSKNKLVINGAFKIGSSYNVEILKGLKAENGKVLEKNVVKDVTFREIEPKIVFSNEGIILPAENKKISFRSINVKKVNVKIKKVYENNTTHFLQEFIFKGNGNIFDYNVSETFNQVGDIVFEKDYDLNCEKNIWKQNEIELGDFVDKKGLFVIEVTFDEKGIDYEFPVGTEEWKKYNLIRNNGRIGKAVLLSHMGITAQKEAEKTVVCVMDILKNTPIKNADVKLVSLNNQVLQEGKTDSRGEFAFKNYDNMMYVLAEKNGEKSILKFRDAQLSYDGFAVDGVFASKGIQAFMYTDRGIYRPGDEVHISFIVRNKGEILPKNHPAVINVYSPTGKKFIEKAVINESKNGFYTYSFKTNTDSETGIWRAEAEIGSEKFVKDISVETVVPYKIKVETTVPEELDINKNSELKIGVQSDYLFGAVGKNLKYTSDIQVREENINFEKYKNYIFKNPTNYTFYYSDYKKGNLDGEGKAEIVFDISKVLPKNINLTGAVTTRVLETNGRPVIKRDIVSLNKFETYVGIKIPENTYIKSGEKLNLEVIAVDKKGENLSAGRELVYRVYKNEYSWWWDYDSYNSFMRSIKTDKNTVLLYEKDFVSGDKPYLIDYAPEGNGEVFVEVEDKLTGQSTGINLYAGTWQDPSLNKKIDKLKIETEQKKYVVGDTAKIIFEGTKGAKALITVEKNGVVSERKWADAENIKNVFELPVTEDMFPNAYVNIRLFQDYTALDNDRPLRLYGAVPVIVENKNKKLNIEIKAPENIKPNEKFTVKVKNLSKTKMDYTVAVVDEGILDITGYKTPDPYGYFYQKLGMQVFSYDNYSEIIGRTFGNVHQILKTGGDGFINEMVMGSSARKLKNMGLEDVQRFKPVAMFKGVLTTDENGEGETEFTIPDYMGAVKVMVVGADNEKYGSAEKEITVKAPVVLESSLPRNLKCGDEFTIPVTVFALEEGVGTAEIVLDFMGDIQKQSAVFSGKGDKTLYFNVKTGEKIGRGQIKISVSSKVYSYEETTDININSNNPYIYINEIRNGEAGKEVSFTQPKDYIKGSAEGKIIISNSPLLAADHRIQELIRYPYGCIEQTVSAMFPQIYIDMLTSNNKFDREKIIGNVNAGIGKLARLQMYDGSFSYWPGGNADVWATVYAGHFLTEAKNRGYYVPEDMYNKIISYEKNLVRNSEVSLETKVYALYVLALGNSPEISQMNLICENYFDSLNTTGKWQLAAAYKLIGDEKLAEETAEKLSLIPEKMSEEYERLSYGSEFRDKAVILNSYYTVFGKAEEKLYKEILAQLQSNEWLSTQSMGQALSVLAHMTEKTSEKEISGIITAGDKKTEFTTEKGIFEYTVPEEAESIKIISNDNSFINYYWEGIPENYQGENISQTIKLARNYYDEQGNLISEKDILSIESGKGFWLEVKMLPADEIKGYVHIDNIALTQVLPSGWEIENIRAVNGEYPQWVEERTANTYVEYEDIRDDRVMWFFDFNNYNAGGNSFFVKVNAVTKGKFDFPGTTAEAMYNNNCRAYLKGFRAEVK